MSETSIEWTHNPDGSPGKTWNPVRGCKMAKGSETKGCLNCYAAAFAARDLPGMRSPTTGKPFARRTENGPRWTGDVELIPEKLDEPLRWRKPQRVFVNSMSDLFHEALTDEAIAAVFGVMAAAGQHTFQILTKRPLRMRAWSDWIRDDRVPVAWCAGSASRAGIDFERVTTKPDLKAWPLPNVWLGVSVEDQATADERIPLLLQTPAAVRFVSYEPALGPVDFTRIKWAPMEHLPNGWTGHSLNNVLTALPADELNKAKVGLDWIIVGGESGPSARPFDVEWARSTVRQCKAAGVPVFVKQLGARPVASGGQDWIGHPLDIRETGNGLETKQHLHYSNRKGGNPSEWPEDLRVREFPPTGKVAP